MVCSDADVDGNIVADCRLGWLISPLYPKDIEASAEITLTKVDGVEVGATPTDWLSDPLFDAAG